MNEPFTGDRTKYGAGWLVRHQFPNRKERRMSVKIVHPLKKKGNGAFGGSK